MEGIKEVVGEHTTVMSLMNGIDSEEQIGKAIGMSHVLPALIKVASRKTENGFCFNPDTTLGIIYGEYQPPYDSERVQAVRCLHRPDILRYRILMPVVTQKLICFPGP